MGGKSFWFIYMTIFLIFFLANLGKEQYINATIDAILAVLYFIVYWMKVEKTLKEK